MAGDRRMLRFLRRLFLFGQPGWRGSLREGSTCGLVECWRRLGRLDRRVLPRAALVALGDGEQLDDAVVALGHQLGQAPDLGGQLSDASIRRGELGEQCFVVAAWDVCTYRDHDPRGSRLISDVDPLCETSSRINPAVPAPPRRLELDAL
jgi:hypothetical protein